MQRNSLQPLPNLGRSATPYTKFAGVCRDGRQIRHDAALAAQLRAQLILWRDNDAKLRPLMQRSFLVKEVAATSQDLSAAAAVGLAALDALETGGGGADEGWRTQQVTVLQQAQKPNGQFLLMPAAAIQKLIEGVGNGGVCTSVKQ